MFIKESSRSFPPGVFAAGYRKSLCPVSHSFGWRARISRAWNFFGLSERENSQKLSLGCEHARIVRTRAHVTSVARDLFSRSLWDPVGPQLGPFANERPNRVRRRRRRWLSIPGTTSLDIFLSLLLSLSYLLLYPLHFKRLRFRCRNWRWETRKTIKEFKA